MSSSSSGANLEARMSDLSQQLNQKDAELDQQVSNFINAGFDEVDNYLKETDRDIEATNKNTKDELRQKVESIKKGVKDRKERLREKIDKAKNAPKEHARKEAENALDAMEEDLSKGDLESAHIDRWVANIWLQASN